MDLPDADVRQKIFSIYLRRRHLNPAAFDLKRLTQAAEGFSGAEIEQAVESALYPAFTEKRPLSTDLIVHELQSTYRLSVTMEERLEGSRQWARPRAVPANQPACSLTAGKAAA